MRDDFWPAKGRGLARRRIRGGLDQLSLRAFVTISPTWLKALN